MSAAAERRTRRSGAETVVSSPDARLVRDAVGKALRRHYDDLLETPLPPRLLALLSELEARETAAVRVPSGEG